MDNLHPTKDEQRRVAGLTFAIQAGIPFQSVEDVVKAAARIAKFIDYGN